MPKLTIGPFFYRLTQFFFRLSALRGYFFKSRYMYTYGWRASILRADALTIPFEAPIKTVLFANVL